MRENRDLVIPVNILTYFARAPSSWAARHTTVCLDDRYYNLIFAGAIVTEVSLNLMWCLEKHSPSTSKAIMATVA